MFNNRHKYILKSPLGKLELNLDPIGWEKSKMKIGRSETSFGMFITVTNNLEFTGESKKHIEDNWLLYGAQARVRLTKFLKHPHTDEWQLDFTGFLDFGTRKIENNKLKIDFVEGGLRELLVSQFREHFEIDRTTDIKGNAISALKTDLISFKGREIFLLSRLSSRSTTSFVIKSGLWSSQGDYREALRPAPVEIVGNSDPDNIRPVVESFGSHGNHTSGGIETKFYALADRDRGRTKATIKIAFRISDVYTDDSSANEMKVFLRRYRDNSDGGGDEFEFVQDYELTGLEAVIDPRSHIGQSFSGNLELEFKADDQSFIKKGESFGLYFWTRGIYGDSGIGNDRGQMQVFIDEYSGSIDWEEDSYFPPTTASFLSCFETGSRLTEIYTGKPAFKSKLLSDKWKDLGLTCGFWVRNILNTKDDLEGEEEEPRTMTINFEELYKTVHAVEPVGYGIVTEGNRQYVVLESLRYFFQPHTTIKLGQVSKIKRRTATNLLYSSITTGYTKGGNYEKPLGLDEHNTQSTSITPITNEGATKYEVLSPSRSDGYAIEEARRKQMVNSIEEDTPYDRDNFLIDAKETGQVNLKKIYEPRVWQDDFEKAPTGIYSPGTAMNLRLTPAYNKYRHSLWFNADTVKTPNEKLRHASNQGNSKLVTKMIGKPEVKEKEDVLYKDLFNPILSADEIEFELPFSQEIKDQLTGRTKIGGEWINNYYGVVEFINEENRKEKAFLFTAEIDDKIIFKTMKAYGI